MLAYGDLSRVNRRAAVFCKVQPGSDLFRHPSARLALAPAAGFLICQPVLEHGDDNDASAQCFEEIAPRQFEVISGPGSKLIAFRFKENFGERLLTHGPLPLCACAAWRIAATMRG